MTRIATAILLAAGLAGGAAAQDAAPPPAGRHAKLTFRIRIPNPVGSKYLNLWIPYPLSDARQTVENVSHRGNFQESGVYREPSQGNTMLFLRWLQHEGDAEVEFSFEVKRREHAVRDPGGRGDGAIPAEVRPCLELDPAVREAVAGIVDSLGVGDHPLRDRARAVYDYVVDHFERDAKIVGCGTGDVPAFLDARKGKCADFSSTFIALARAAGVPAREVYGLRLSPAPKADASDDYHCWSEFYLPEVGWVPADPSDVRRFARAHGLGLADERVRAQREYFFGAVDADRVALGGGMKVKLAPLQSLGPLPYFMCPYLEVGYESNCEGADLKKMDLKGLVFTISCHPLAERTSLIGVGESAPPFEGAALDGSVVRFEELLGRRTIVLNFFSTWCGRCAWESEGLDRIADDYRDRGVRVVRVCANEKREKVADFAKRHEIRLPILLDPNATIAELYGMKYVPTTILIGNDGVVKFAGGLMPEKDLRERLDVVLEKGR